MPKCMSIQPPPSNLEEVTAEILEAPGHPERPEYYARSDRRETARIGHVRDILEHTSLVMCFLVRACRGLEPRFGEGGHLGGVGSQ
jgi:hypothetical protein